MHRLMKQSNNTDKDSLEVQVWMGKISNTQGPLHPLGKKKWGSSPYQQLTLRRKGRSVKLDSGQKPQCHQAQFCQGRAGRKTREKRKA